MTHCRWEHLRGTCPMPMLHTPTLCPECPYSHQCVIHTDPLSACWGKLRNFARPSTSENVKLFIQKPGNKSSFILILSSTVFFLTFMVYLTCYLMACSLGHRDTHWVNADPPECPGPHAPVHTALVPDSVLPLAKSRSPGGQSAAAVGSKLKPVRNWRQ